jgi:hypothetical protein
MKFLRPQHLLQVPRLPQEWPLELPLQELRLWLASGPAWQQELRLEPPPPQGPPLWWSWSPWFLRPVSPEFWLRQLLPRL